MLQALVEVNYRHYALVEIYRRAEWEEAAQAAMAIFAQRAPAPVE